MKVKAKVKNKVCICVCLCVTEYSYAEEKSVSECVRACVSVGGGRGGVVKRESRQIQ